LDARHKAQTPLGGREGPDSSSAASGGGLEPLALSPRKAVAAATGIRYKKAGRNGGNGRPNSKTEGIAMSPVIWIIIGAVVVLILAVIVVYNSLVMKRVRVNEAWSQIDVQLKRRYDLIPNLVETVKGYAAHEKETLERVIQARNQAISAQGVNQQAEAENMLTGALNRLFALSEAYPDLKANQNFAQLQEELTGTENRIAFARQHYNDSVAVYNIAIQKFPNNLMAGPLGFKKRDMFELSEPEQREAPKVSFS
jgi:LemA protein